MSPRIEAGAERSFVSVKADSVIIPLDSFALARSVENFRIPETFYDLRLEVNVCVVAFL